MSGKAAGGADIVCGMTRLPCADARFPLFETIYCAVLTGAVSEASLIENIGIRLLIICPLVFVGAAVDAIAGGGGLITLPAYLIAGIPPQFAVGTNKFSASCGAVSSAVRFIRSGVVQFQTALPATVFAIIGSVLGAKLLLVMDERILQIMLTVMLPVMAMVLLRSKGLDADKSDLPPIPAGKAVAVSSVIGLIVGAYDGFFGPGAGTFFTLAFTFLLRMELRSAMGNTKIVNFASNFAAMVTFLLEGRVLFAIGIPAAVCSIAGSYVGAGLALKGGAKVFKPVFLIVFALLLIRVVSGLMQ